MFRLSQPDDVAGQIRSIACAQNSKAIADLDSEVLSQASKIHQVRKRCKKLRGLIRLARPTLVESYQTENDWYRETAQPLSDLRDAKTMQDTYDSVMDAFADQVKRDEFGMIRRRLTIRRKKLVDENNVDELLHLTSERFVEARRRVESWQFDEKGFAAVKGGFKKTYSRAVRALKKARSEPSAENFHAFRKRVKYHSFHCWLLRDLWRGPMRERTDEADRLGELLGDDHDLNVLSNCIDASPDEFGAKKNLKAFRLLLAQRSLELRKQGLQLGSRLFAESPSAIADRFETYWDVWKHDKQQHGSQDRDEPAD